MPNTLFLINQLRKKFLSQDVKDFNVCLPQNVLDIEDKNRSNLFGWRGQFSPQLIENIMLAYTPKNAIIFDPFIGSGTILYTAGCLGLKALGCELNPAALILSRTYQLINLKQEEREKVIASVNQKLDSLFSISSFFESQYYQPIPIDEFGNKLKLLYEKLEGEESIIVDTLVILLDISAKNNLMREKIYKTSSKLYELIRDMPYSEERIISLLGDARQIPLEEDQINFVITSPPYINVFNYHQNYRNSVELLGWNLLKIAKSEIGSNRANRGNRFLTVIQYCLDLVAVLQELQRICQKETRMIFVVGYQSTVLGVPFYNSEIIIELVKQSGVFEQVLTQKRQFKNKFGQIIREDLLHLINKKVYLSVQNWDTIAREVAKKALRQGLEVVSEKNYFFLQEAIHKVPDVNSSPYWYQ
ncbi:DNA methyltransferase [Planktothrix mougeotii]|uniref:site-specific DNA-methyltransferase (cytosine-N(4)-specific) n=1 Tax=Planktothrix mougeotii LEGE 06226 TaxID=1828728 RepID=A0ABR9UFQ2_9CYAN|nr:DNA methyltransferase [Planktothrix mougeotii]MBE9145283.1 methyltransferase [Planktothrix mougeotii LEGE 06226]